MRAPASALRAQPAHEPAPATRSSAAGRCSPLLAAFADGYGFVFDDYQREACAHVEAGSGVLVAAPTGAGKTIVGEFAVFLALTAGPQVLLHHADQGAVQPEVRRPGPPARGRPGRAADRGLSINSEAPVVVMTTEVLRNMIYAGSSTLANLGYVVMDEVHYLADRFRGAVWEEVIIGLAESIQVVALSATVSNAEEFGEWLSEVRGEMAVVVSERRPVPLFQHVLVGHDAVRPVRRRRADRAGGAGRAESRSIRRCCGWPGRSRGSSATTPGGRAGAGGRGRRNVRYGSGAYGGAAGATTTAPAAGPGRCTGRAGRRSSSCWTARPCCRRSSSSSPGPAATQPCGSSWAPGCG